VLLRPRSLPAAMIRCDRHGKLLVPTASRSFPAQVDTTQALPVCELYGSIAAFRIEEVQQARRARR